VQFKHSFRDFITYPTSPLHIEIDDYVRVEADRGEDIGVVRQIFHTKNESQIRNLSGILRLATPEEKYLLPIKAHEEAQAVEVMARDCNISRSIQLISV
jgi:cell fate regulator YaaT (PSP1 superfamily)